MGGTRVAHFSMLRKRHHSYGPGVVGVSTSIHDRPQDGGDLERGMG
jgi:hypothetical protein